MNAPNLWQQLIIAVIAIALLPTVIALLIKLRVFPLVALWLIVDSFEEWAQANETLCTWLFVAFIAYPVIVWSVKFIRWWKEEQRLKYQMLATAIPWYELAPQQAGNDRD